MTRKLTPPLKYHGGKHYLAKRIVALMPPHLVYCEPFCGGCSVLFARDPDRDWYKGASDWKETAAQRGASEIVNDINGELMNFWRTLQSPESFAEMQRCLDATPFSQPDWELAGEATRFYDINDPQRAYAFFVRCRQSLAGRMKDFAPLSGMRTRGGRNEQANAWLNAIDGLPAVHERLKGVVILSRDALDVIRQQDGDKTLFYLDPPYLHETRVARDVYKHEMTKQQHYDLLTTLSDIQGTFLLSGYRSPTYDVVANRCGWHRVDFNLANNAAGGDKKRRMIECVWMNYEPPTTEDAK